MSIALAKSLVRGTCVVANGTYEVTGDETNFLADVESGFLMYIAGVFYQVDKVISANKLMLTQPFIDTLLDGISSEDPDGTLHYWFQIIPTHAYTLAVNKSFEETSRKLDELTVSLPIPGDNSISNGQLANMPPSTIKARFAGSTGDPQDITVDQLATMLINAGYPFSSSGSGSGVPNGGQTGNVLVKNSNLSGDAVWKPLSTLIGATGAEAYRGPWGLYLEKAVLEFDQNYIPEYFEANAQATPLRVILDPDAINGTTKALTFPQIGNNAFCEVQWPIYADENLDTLRIRYKANGEPGYDPFVVYIDGVEVFKKWGDEQLWQDWSYTLPHGAHVVKFAYYSDGNSQRGIQNVRWSRIEFPRQQQDQQYNYGDTVNFNGSTWFCLKPGTTAEPGSNNDWRAFGGAGSGGSGGSGSLIFSSDATGADTFTMDELHIGQGIDSVLANGKVTLTGVPAKVGKRGANGTDVIAGDGRKILFQGDIVTTSIDGDSAIVNITTPHDIPTGGAVNQVLTKMGVADRQVGWTTLPANPLMTGGTARQVLAKNSTTAGDLIWTTLREPPTGGTTGQRLAKSSNADGAFTWVNPEIPAGGAQGKILGKLSATTGDIGWIDPPSTLPSGGNTRAALIKNSATTGDVKWENLREVPPGGTVRQRLVKADSQDGNAIWVDPEIPAGGTTGQALRKLTDMDREIAWQDVHEVPPGGVTGEVLTKLSETDWDANWRPNKKIKYYLDTFTSSGTWTMRPGAFKVSITGVGAGGAGQGGASGNVFAVRNGGASGSGGAFNKAEFAAADLPSTVSVTIAAKVSGTDGAVTPVSPPGNSSVGSPYSNGATTPMPAAASTSSFGSLMTFKGGVTGTVTADGTTMYQQGQGALSPGSGVGTNAPISHGSAGGGTGGGLTNSSVSSTQSTGGFGGTGTIPQSLLRVGRTATTPYHGLNGYDVVPDRAFRAGAGGGGGAAIGATMDTDTTGGDGGHGGYGAGGGGGGAGTHQGGRGGDGGPSIIWVETWTEE